MNHLISNESLNLPFSGHAGGSRPPQTPGLVEPTPLSAKPRCAADRKLRLGPVSLPTEAESRCWQAWAAVQ